MADTKSRVQLRLDSEIHQALKALSEEAEVSLNSLIEGLCGWAAQYGHPGEPIFVPDSDECHKINPVGRVLWFGTPAQSGTDEDEQGRPFSIEASPDVFFMLDFRHRHRLPPRRTARSHA